MLTVRQLDWDTAFFGVRMGSILPADESPTVPTAAPLEAPTRDLDLLLHRARAEGYAHLIYRMNADDFPSIWSAEASGFHLVDIGIDARLPGWVRLEQRLERGRGRRSALAKGRARHKSDQRLPQPLPQPFIIREEEAPVPHHRPAHIRAKLIQPKRRQLRGIEWRARIEDVVAHGPVIATNF